MQLKAKQVLLMKINWNAQKMGAVLFWCAQKLHNLFAPQIRISELANSSIEHFYSVTGNTLYGLLIPLRYSTKYFVFIYQIVALLTN